MTLYSYQTVAMKYTDRQINPSKAKRQYKVTMNVNGEEYSCVHDTIVEAMLFLEKARQAYHIEGVIITEVY